MSTVNEPAQGSKTRFRISLFILASLFIAKLVSSPSQTGNESAEDNRTTQTDSMDGSFQPVPKENSDTWGFVGSMLNLFSGGKQSPARLHQTVEDEKARQAEDDSRFMNQKWKEDEEQRRHDADDREQEMRQQERQRQQENNY